mgnify:CR=1 FL=1
MSFVDVYESIPIRIVNTGVLRAMLWELSSAPSLAPTFDTLDLSTSSFIETHLEQLLDCIGKLQTETQNYQKALQRLLQQRQAFIAKRVRCLSTSAYFCNLLTFYDDNRKQTTS